ncbi:MAG TPA: CinA family protein [Devosia sp.]
MFSPAIRERSKRVIERLVARGEMIVTAESCTGGLIAGALTDIAGSSEAVHGGFVTYANRAKLEMIGVDEDLLERWGAVSESVARAMAEGARETAGVEVSLAVTGIAGPGGGNELKPVGLVYLACTTAAGTTVIERRFGDIGRQQVREATVLAALDLVLECLG